MGKLKLKQISKNRNRKFLLFKSSFYFKELQVFFNCNMNCDIFISDISIANPSNVRMVPGVNRTGDIVEDKNKTYLNLSSSIKCSDDHSVTRNSVINSINNICEVKNSGSVGINSELTYCCNTSFTSQLKSWEREELNAKLKQDVPMDDVLLSVDSGSKQLPDGLPFGGGLQFAMQRINKNKNKKDDYVDHQAWYQNCVKNFCLQDEDGDT